LTVLVPLTASSATLAFCAPVKIFRLLSLIVGLYFSRQGIA
jgi:hypothetical protein